MHPYCDRRGTTGEQGLQISTKGQPEDFCTQVDVDNEDLVTKGLAKAFPDHAIIGEESTGTGSIPRLTSSKPTWIIDPIDGTTNFASGLPLTCVSIGLCVDGEPTIAVIYAPMTEEVFLAVKGFGAYRNGVRLAMRTQVPTLEGSVVCFEFGYARDPPAVDKMVGAVRSIMVHGCRTSRQLGSGVLDLCYVASGRLDVVYAGVAGEGWKPWDYCAGVVVAHETGCVTESIDQVEGEPFDLYSKSVICAGSRDLLRELRSTILSINK